MAIFELINFSDAIHFEAESMPVACVAALLLNTVYGVKEINPDTMAEIGSAGPFFFDDADSIKKFLSEKFDIADLDEWVANHKAALEAAWQSFAYGSLTEFIFFKKAVDAIEAPAKRQAFIDDWDDKQRTSLSQIVAHARGCKFKHEDTNHA